MKKIIVIMLYAVFLMSLVSCAQAGINRRISQVEGSVNTDVAAEQITPLTPELTEAPTEAPTPTPEPTPEPIDYENLFDFSGWDKDFEAAENKEEFIKSYWKDVAYKTFINRETYTLIKSDPMAKQAFINEVKEEMLLQEIKYMESCGYTVDEPLKQLISDTIDEQMLALSESIK